MSRLEVGFTLAASMSCCWHKGECMVGPSSLMHVTSCELLAAASLLALITWERLGKLGSSHSRL